MNKEKWNIWDLLAAVLLALIVMAEVRLALTIRRVDAETPHVEAVMEEAQARIDAYYASLPARERPVVVSVEAEPEPPAVEASQEPAEAWYIEDLPLARELQQVAYNAACDSGVDYLLVLAVMKTESDFDPSAVSCCGSYGLMQLNPRYFPAGLADAENIQVGTAYLGQLLEQYQGDVPAALRAYNRGYDDGDRAYSNAVMDAAEEIMAAGVTGP